MPEALLAELQHAGVRRVVDVRHRPQSRRPGMSKTRLGEMLRAHSIAYENQRALGTPPDLRWLYRNNRLAEAAQRFHAHVESTAGEDLDALARSISEGTPTALLCYEADPATCHRRVITDALRERCPGLVVVDL